MRKPSELTIPLVDGGATPAVHYPAESPTIDAALVLAHGAGAGQRSQFMTTFAGALSSLGLDVVTFDFPYITAGRRIPDRPPVLEACYRAVVREIHARIDAATRWLFVGGKSMGGRIASQIAAADRELPIAGLVLLGYPLHPPGKPAERRDRHLPSIRRPMLVVQGARDAFGTPSQLTPVLNALQPPATLHVIADADHSFKLTRADRAAQAAVFANIQQDIVAWIRSVINAPASFP